MRENDGHLFLTKEREVSKWRSLHFRERLVFFYENSEYSMKIGDWNAVLLSYQAYERLGVYPFSEQ